MKTTLSVGAAMIVALVLAVVGARFSSAQDKGNQKKDRQDKYTLQIPGWTVIL